ncbi:site-specific integrase [Bradyrhizobium sp. 30]|uniref:tyrosine-type recombinase/integrase n=1 Tax=Bradyrhizobium sp. 30 TaxID=2782669 RepID=UPI001FFA0134|nr:integrase arm-type DNA-binding domain-containing protein [Bradyrhizobium sp. 30]
MPVLTAASIAKYKPHPTKRREISDSKAQGLRLVIQPAKTTGRKGWIIRLRRPNGKTAKLTLGRVDLSDKETSDQPVQGSALTLGQARELAAQIDRERARGIDVVAERKAEKLRDQIAAADRATNSFGTIVREFFIKHRTKKWNSRPRRWRDDAATLGLRYPPGSDPATMEPEIIKGGLAEAWTDRPIADIDKYQVEAAVEDARKHGSDSRARKLYSALSVLFSWLPLKYRVEISPMIGVKRPGPPASRERVLTNAEIMIFWKATDALGGVFGPLYRTLLLTGCRLREVSGMTRAELGDKGVWEVPSSRTKNHLAFVVPLPQLALDIINTVPPTNQKNEPGLVFTTSGKTPISGFSKAKKALNAETEKIVKRDRSKDSDSLPFAKPWRVHDLRRTFSTVMNESPDDGGLGIAPHVVEACLNHISGSAKANVAGVYNKAKNLPEKRIALQRWASHIEGLVAGRKANVTPLRSKKRS